MLADVGDAIPFEAVEAVTSAEELTALQGEVRSVAVSPDMADYIVALTGATRSHPSLRLGASPRASKALFKCAKALAAGRGRAFVTPDDVQELALPVLSHRLVLTAEARMSGQSPESVLTGILESLPVPPARDKLFRDAGEG